MDYTSLYQLDFSLTWSTVVCETAPSMLPKTTVAVWLPARIDIAVAVFCICLITIRFVLLR